MSVHELMMRYALEVTAGAAVGWIAGRDLCADPAVLLQCCASWTDVVVKGFDGTKLRGPDDLRAQLRAAGESAAGECSHPAPKQVLQHLIEPGDLQ